VELLVAALDHVRREPARFSAELGTHVALSGLALALAMALAIPAGVLVARRPRLALATLGVANTLRALPSLAVLALMLPVLGIGFRPALVALVVVGVPSILTNTSVGLGEVDPDAVESARAMGMAPLEVLARIELPLAMPVILAGVRTAAVQVVASATLAAFIGGGGLGDFIVTGIAMMRMELLLVGAIPVTLLAIATDTALGALERVVTPRGLRDPA
jgi:osmoprotectant transport system permease protein